MIRILRRISQSDKTWLMSKANYSNEKGYWSQVLKPRMLPYKVGVPDARLSTVTGAIGWFKLCFRPPPIKYTSFEDVGHKPFMKKDSQQVSWDMPAETIVRSIKMSNTGTAVIASLPQLGHEALLSGGIMQYSHEILIPNSIYLDTSPGTIVAKKNGALLIRAGDGNFVWVTHIKEPSLKNNLKLPAELHLTPGIALSIPEYYGYSSFEEIKTRFLCGGQMALIQFEFYNGAMCTDQCHRLQRQLQYVAKNPNVKIVILLGGKEFFSTGIHLGIIEASRNPAEESWKNTNALNNLIQTIFSMEDKVTISALQGGAGAGGVMMAAAADLMWARKGISVKPSYKNMQLYGSGYWSYFLPSRVGKAMAEELAESEELISIETVERMGLVDKTFGRSREEFCEMLLQNAQSLLESKKYIEILREKQSFRGINWYKMVENHRQNELWHLVHDFSSKKYAEARHAFLYS